MKKRPRWECLAAGAESDLDATRHRLVIHVDIEGQPPKVFAARARMSRAFVPEAALHPGANEARDYRVLNADGRLQVLACVGC